MKKVLIIGLAIILILITIIALIVINFINDPIFTGITKNYMLKNVDINEQDKYVLVRFRVGSHDFVREVIDDNKLLYKNRNDFCIVNSETAYGTTCEGFFDLYKNGKLIVKEIYDPYMEVTKKIDYGTLEDTFVPVTKKQLEEMLKR